MFLKCFPPSVSTSASLALCVPQYPHTLLTAFSSCPYSQGGIILLLLCSVAVVVLSALNVGKSILFVMTPHLLATSSLMPFIGFLLGYLLSALFCLNGR